MSSDPNAPQAGPAGDSGDSGAPEGPPPPPPTPFDHPFFLPALFFGATVWFGYDGWLNTDPEMLEHQDFNRYGFPVVLAGFLWFLYKGVREWREDKEREAQAQSQASPPQTGG